MPSTQRHGGAAIIYLVKSILLRHEWFWFFRKNTSYIPGDNGSSLNIPITIKIIALTNRTIIKTTVSLLYLLVHYLIFNPPLLCTSSWRFEICLPPIYDLIAFSPDDQIQPKLFVPIKGTNTYISSNRFVLNRSISMELRFNTFPLSWGWDNIFHFNS